MHLKSCSKLVRSELRLDLNQQQGALLRRSQNTRLPLAALSTNTLRCSTHNPNNGSAVRAKGVENSGFTEEEASALDVWSVIKPGHVREKIALFALETSGDRNAKGSWEVTVKRRRRSSQIQPPPPAPQVQPQTPVAPQVCPEDEAKLSVVEMVAFLEQHVTCQSQVKLRSSASITLTRAPPLSPPVPAPTCPDRPITVEGEEPETVSVSDMVAKLESQCLRRKSQNGERRTVGRVLLASLEQNPAPLLSSQPIGTSEKLKATSHSSETRKTLSFCKLDLKVTSKVMPSLPFSSEKREVSKPLAAFSEQSNAIGREKTVPLPYSQTESETKSLRSCSADKTVNAKPSLAQTCNTKELKESTTKPAAAILSCQSETKAPVSSEVTSTKIYQAEKGFCNKTTTQTALVSPDMNKKSENTKETPVSATSQLQAAPTLSSKSEKSPETPSYEEPVPGLLFLTPPSIPSVQSEKRKLLSPASSSLNSHSDSFLVLSTSDVTGQPEKRKSSVNGCCTNSDSFVVLSPDLTIQSKTRARCSFSLSPTSSQESKNTDSPDSEQLSINGELQKRKVQPCLPSPASNSDSGPIKTLKSKIILRSETFNASFSGEKRKSCPATNFDSPPSLDTALNLSVQSQKRKSRLTESTSLDFVIQSEKSKLSNVQSERTYFQVTNTNAKQSENGKKNYSDLFLLETSLDLSNQSEKRKPCLVTDFSVQSETRISGAICERLLIKSQSEKSVDRLAQSEKRKSCPLPGSGFLDFSSQSEKWKALPASLEKTGQSEKRKSCSVTHSDWSNLNVSGQSVKRKACIVTNLDLVESAIDDQSEKRNSHPASSLDTLTDPQSCLAIDSDWSNSECTSQSEKRKVSTRVTKSELSNSAENQTVKSKSCLATHSDQSEKRKSCPLPSSLSLDILTDSRSQPEKSKLFLLTDSSLILQSESSIPVGSSVLLRSSSDVGSLGDRRRRRKAVRAFSLCSDLAPARYRAASEDFLLMRRRVQRLLEPRSQQSYLSLLPHHLLVHILLLLPTRALAALKCTCQYFQLIIDTYDVRPADSLWVCDPRYRDDPCKQCKRRYRRGDVSLCRWHHKPFCQAMPYGPGYWMCCHGDRRDAPGCNVGLHDNRWVPAFHSINAPIYRQVRGREEER